MFTIWTRWPIHQDICSVSICHRQPSIINEFCLFGEPIGLTGDSNHLLNYGKKFMNRIKFCWFFFFFLLYEKHIHFNIFMVVISVTSTVPRIDFDKLNEFIWFNWLCKDNQTTYPTQFSSHFINNVESLRHSTTSNYTHLLQSEYA